jgi:hypothetical protein
MVQSVMAEPSMIPLRSREVFGPLFFLTRLASSFSVDAAGAPALGRTLSSLFAVLLVTLTGAGAVVLWRQRRRDQEESGPLRRFELFVFQAAIGFLMVALSPDVSITLLLPVMVSLYAPLWLLPEPGAAWRRARVAVPAGLFVIGMVLIGNLIPLSIVQKAIPFGVLDRAAGNAAAAMSPHEKFMWYQIPLAGLACLIVSFCGSFVVKYAEVSGWRHEAHE